MSSLTPIDVEDGRMVRLPLFYDSDDLVGFLGECLVADLAYQTERVFLSGVYRKLGKRAVEAFETFWEKRGQDTNNPPPTMDTIIVSYDPMFRHYFDQLRGIFFTHATGKQAPSSNSTAKSSSSETSTGDIQKLPDDQILAFIKAVPKILDFIATDTNIRQKQRRFGFNYVKPGFKIKIRSDLHLTHYINDIPEDSEPEEIHMPDLTEE